MKEVEKSEQRRARLESVALWSDLGFYDEIRGSNQSLLQRRAISILPIAKQTPGCCYFR